MEYLHSIKLYTNISVRGSINNSSLPKKKENDCAGDFCGAGK